MDLNKEELRATKNMQSSVESAEKTADEIFEELGYEIENLIRRNQELEAIEADYVRRMKTSNKLLLKQGYISKDKIRELKEKIHKTLDENGITRAYQLEIDGYFNKVLEEE